MSKTSKFVSSKIKKLLDEGYEKDQAAAIAYSMARKKKSKEG